MQESDFLWFVENMKDLFMKYGHSFLAIKNKKVLGSYSSYAEGVHETEKTEQIGTFIIQKCGQDESAYTVNISSMNFCTSEG